MDHTNHVRLTSDELHSTFLEGATIYDSEDNDIGAVSHVHGTGSESIVIVDVGGFLGIGAKPVALAATELDFMRDENGEVHGMTSWSKDQLKELPEHRD